MGLSAVHVLYRRLAVAKSVKYGKGLHVGIGSRLWAPNLMTIGNDVYVGKYATLEVDGVVGDGVLIANSVGLVGRRDHDVRFLGSTARRAPWVGDVPALSSPLTIGADVWIGYGAIVLSGVTVGDSSVVAAGALVTADVPPNAVVAGTPARVVARRFGQQDLAHHWRLLESQGVRRLTSG